MSYWDTYQARIEAAGGSIGEAKRKRELRYLDQRLRDTLSYQKVTVDGVEREASVIDSDNYNEKTLISMVREDFDLGGLVSFNGSYWLITEKDHNNHLYTKVKLEQCNFLLKWIDESGEVHEQWCIVSDGTKYLTGEYEDQRFIATRGDARIAIVIARNEYTLQFSRKTRFIIHDPESKARMAFTLTKPLTVGRTYNGKGIFAFVLQETAPTDDDDLENMVADYYKYHPKDHLIDLAPNILINPQDEDDRGRKNWL